MTTVILDAKNKVAYTDSRMTTTNIDIPTGKVLSTKYSKVSKAFQHKSGKMLCAVTGDYDIALPKLKALGFITKGLNINTGNPTITSEDKAIILITSISSGRCWMLEGEGTSTGKVKWSPRSTLHTCMWGGSGIKSGIVCKLMRYRNLGLNIKYETMIKAASLLDEGTNDDVRIVKL